jgi:collagenase-like PrtC family protease
MSIQMEEMNLDDIEAVSKALAALNALTEVHLHGSLMVDIDGRHLGYVILNGESETTFSQRPAA